MGEEFDPRVYSAMQTGKPFAQYVKTTLGKVYVTVLSPFSGQPEGLLLTGDPKKNEDSAFIEVWTEKENVFFTRANRRLFETGLLLKVERKEKEVVKDYTQYSDEELKEVLKERYLKFLQTLGNINSEIVLFRLLELAEAEEKSEKITSKIKARLSEIQLPSMPNKIEVER